MFSLSLINLGCGQFTRHHFVSVINSSLYKSIVMLTVKNSNVEFKTKFSQCTAKLFNDKPINLYCMKFYGFIRVEQR